MDSDHDSHTKETDDNAAGPGVGDGSSGEDSNYRDNVEYQSDAGRSDGSGDGSSGEDSNDTGYVECQSEVDSIGGNSSSQRSSNYVVLSEDNVRKIQEEETARVSSVLCVSRAESTVLLVHYNWDSEKVQEEWLTDQDRVRKAVGLLLSSSAETRSAGETNACGACSRDRGCRDKSATFCGHLFCNECWVDHIAKSCTGQECLRMRCLEPCCGAAVGQNLVERLGSNRDNNKYRRFLVRSYVEGSSRRKWCPAPRCEFMVEFILGSEGGDVRCKCGHVFCWICTEEAHWPLDCEEFANWMAESKSTTWILTNCKPCPKCKRPIEKDYGCMHMTCAPPCGFGFCWLCLGAWSDAFETHSCKGYAEEATEETMLKRKTAKMYMDRYVHYFERWAANHSWRGEASERVQIMKRERLDRLVGEQSVLGRILEEVIEAWEEVVEWRRVLTWTYAYCYFLQEHERRKIGFFEQLQGQAECSLEKLDQCAGREFRDLLEAKNPSIDQLNGFRTKLSGLTIATGAIFKDLVQALEREQAASRGGGFLHES